MLFEYITQNICIRNVLSNAILLGGVILNNNHALRTLPCDWINILSWECVCHLRNEFLIKELIGSHLSFSFPYYLYLYLCLSLYPCLYVVVSLFWYQEHHHPSREPVHVSLRLICELWWPQVWGTLLLERKKIGKASSGLEQYHRKKWRGKRN